MARVPAETIRERLAVAAESAGLLLEDVVITTPGRRTVVRTVVDLPDGPGGVTSDQLADATRAVSAALDELDPFPGQYTLEVTTPGIDRPLTEPRHFRRAVGRRVEARTADGTTTGHLTEVTDDHLVIGDVEVPLDAVTEARMTIDFGSSEE